MNRLIDADALMEYLGIGTDEAREENRGEIVTAEDIDRQRTAYDVDKVVERLKGSFNSAGSKAARLAFRDAIEIVRGGGVDE